jgi:hypothetical protein
MSLHLDMNEGGQWFLVIDQNIASFVLGKVRTKVPDQLPGKVIQQVSVFVVVDVIKIDEAPDSVIFQPLFWLHLSAKAQRLLLMRPKVVDEQIPIRRLVVDIGAIKGEGVKPCRDLASRLNGDSGDIDGLLNH